MKHVASVSVRLHECQDRTCHCDVKDTPKTVMKRMLPAAQDFADQLSEKMLAQDRLGLSDPQ